MDDRCVSPLAYDNRPIGVFDSGLGGLTVARSIATSLSHESIYYCDVALPRIDLLRGRYEALPLWTALGERGAYLRPASGALARGT